MKRWLTRYESASLRTRTTAAVEKKSVGPSPACLGPRPGIPPSLLQEAAILVRSGKKGIAGLLPRSPWTRQIPFPVHRPHGPGWVSRFSAVSEPVVHFQPVFLGCPWACRASLQLFQSSISNRQSAIMAGARAEELVDSIQDFARRARALDRPAEFCPLAYSLCEPACELFHLAYRAGNLFGQQQLIIGT